MKRLLLAAMVMTSVATANAQDKNMPKSMATAEKNQSINIRFSPIGLLVGMVAVKGDYLITDNIAIGGSVVYWNWSLFDNTLKVTGFGLHGTYYFNPRFQDSWYLTGGLGSSSIDATLSPTNGTRRTASLSGITGFHVGGGYHWFWNSFNLNLGYSLGNSSATKVEYKDASGNVVDSVNVSQITGGPEFLIGWSF